MSSPEPLEVLATGAAALFGGGSEMRDLCRDFEWAATPLGGIEGWPPALRTAVRLMLASPIATSLWCGTSYTLLYNDAYRRILGVKHPCALGRSGADVWDELWPALEARFSSVRSEGASVYEDESLLTMKRLEGGRDEDGWFTYSLSPLEDEDGSCLAVYNLAVEITEKVRARGILAAEQERTQHILEERVLSEAALRESEARYRALFESLDEGFCVIEMIFDDAGAAVDYRFLEANPAFVKQTGLRDALGRRVKELLPRLESHWLETYGRVATTGEPVRFHNRVEELDRWYDAYAFRLGEPEEHRVAVLFNDVSGARQAEGERERLVAALEVERARLEQVFRRAPSFIVALRGPDQVYEFVNEAYYQLVGHRDILGKPLLEAIPEIRGQGFQELLEQVRQTGVPWVGRESPVQLQRTPGAQLETRYLDMVFQALTESDGTRSGVVAHGSDVTEQVLARREVERLLAESEAARREAEGARAEAEAANRAKSEFLAVMSHELRTPLNAIGGYAELLEMGIRGPVTQPQVDDLRRIQSSHRHLLGLINEVLNYAKIETGTVHYDLADVPLREAVSTTELLVAPQARAKGLQLMLVDCPTSLVARADPEKLRQILVNLASNAVKFTEPGGQIGITCEARGDSVAVRVRDTGIGIPRDKLEAIFDPFVQVRSDLTRPHEGTGLGLAISRNLARGMGGDLTVESRKGSGSTFTLVLPAA